MTPNDKAERMRLTRALNNERETIARLAERSAENARTKHNEGAPAPDAWLLVASWFDSFAGTVRIRRYAKKRSRR